MLQLLIQGAFEKAVYETVKQSADTMSIIQSDKQCFPLGDVD